MDCPTCGGIGVVCIDDICRGLGECIHGDGMCPTCGGEPWQQYTCRIRDAGVSSDDEEGDIPYMSDVVNLDALIERDDFLAAEGSDAGQQGKVEITRTDLTEGESFYITLRKPDFQRETAAWSPESVCDFIEAFIDGDLIPSVICWQSPSRLSFVIDGAHRLSAIIAWLSDDYGNGKHSVKFYNNEIPVEQRRIADKTRELVNRRIGAYRDLQAETKNPGSNPRLTARARALAHCKIPLLWVSKGDSKKAEHAFLKINKSGVQIDATELQIIQNRFTPSAVAARAIVRNATGYEYWRTFSEPGREEMRVTGTELYKLLYSPPYQPPIRTTDLPIAGHGHGSQTLPLVYDLVNIANGLPVVDASQKPIEKKGKKRKGKGGRAGVADRASDSLGDDGQTPERADEAGTLAALRQTRRLARLLTGTHPSSLGLHPAIYFYASNGKHQATAVMAVAAMVRQLEEDHKLLEFTDVRVQFEEFLVAHKIFINQLTTFHGSMAKGYRQVRDYLVFVLNRFIAGDSAELVSENLRNHEKYQRLVKSRAITSQQVKDFSKNLKQWAFLKEAIKQSTPCHLCKAAVDYKSMHMDHIKDKKDGGLADGANAAWAHPFCNSTYKEHLRAGGRLSV
jgi:hypothetical protein